MKNQNELPFGQKDLADNKFLINMLIRSKKFRNREKLIKLKNTESFRYLLREHAKLSGLYLNGLLTKNEKELFKDLDKQVIRINNIIDPPREKTEWEKFMETR